MEPLLKIEHYSVAFRQYERGFRQRKLLAVEDLNLEICSGEVVAAVGASGSGKSLLAHGILGILPYNATAEGKILFRGEELTKKRVEKLRGSEIVLIPQNATFLDPLMKVGNQILKGSRKDAQKARMREIFGQYRLDEDVVEKYPFELSGGMTRRIFLTAAQMETPGLVVADEPTPGLHKDMAAMALGHLRELAEKGTGVLLITHDLEQALMVADRLVVFYEGKSIEEVRAEDFLQEETLKHPYTRALWRALPENGFVCPKEGEWA